MKKKIYVILCLLAIMVTSFACMSGCSFIDNKTKQEPQPEPQSEVYTGIFADPDTKLYSFTSDYQLSEQDYLQVGGRDNVISLPAVSFDLDGHTFDLNGYTLSLSGTEKCIVSLKNGKVQGGNLDINVPNGDIEFDGVELADDVTTSLTAAPSTVYLKSVVSAKAVVLRGSSRMVLEKTSLKALTASGSATVDVGEGCSVDNLETTEEGDGGAINVSETAVVAKINLFSAVQLDVRGVVTDIVVAQINGQSVIVVKVVIYITATVEKLDLNDSADVTVSGQLGEMNVSEGIAPERQPVIDLQETAVISVVKIYSPVAMDVKGRVQSFDVAQNAQGGRITLLPTAAIVFVDIKAPIELEVNGNIGSFNYAPIGGTPENSKIVINENAKLQSFEVSGIAEVLVFGFVGTFNVPEGAEDVPVIVIEVTAIVEVIELGSPADLDIGGNVQTINVEDGAEGCDIVVAPTAVIVIVVIETPVIMDVQGDVSMIQVLPAQGEHYTESNIKIDVQATVKVLSVSDEVTVDVEGKVEEIDVGGEEGSNPPSINIGENAEVSKVEIKAVVEIIILGNVDNLVLTEEAKESLISLLNEAVIEQIVLNAESVQLILDETVEIEVVFIIEDTETGLEEYFGELIVKVPEEIMEELVVHNHIYVELEREESTCIANGKVISVCSCGDKKEEQLPLSEHDYQLSELVNATCSEEGLATYVCSVCGDVHTEVLPKSNHDYEEKERINATCTETGLVTYVCKNCQDEKTTVTAQIGHEYKITELVEPTCTVNGHITFTCTHCEDSYTVISYGEHDYAVSARKDAVCAEEGYVEYQCKNCESNYREVIPAGAHHYVRTEYVKATTEQEGKATYTCESCSDSYEVILPIRKSGSYVLLIQDSYPWTENNNSALLNKLVEDAYITGWDMTATSDLAEVEFFDYSVIYIANDQETSAYDKLGEYTQKLCEFAEAGGTVVYGICDHGWSGGDISFELPYGIKKINNYSAYNYIHDYSNYIVTGELTDNKALTNEILHGNYCSHTSLVAETLPDDSSIILTDGKGDPTLVEFKTGEGCIILSGLTWEFYYRRDMSGLSTTYSKSVYDDLIVYAVAMANKSVHIHEYDLGSVIEPKCGEEGYTVHTCTICGKTFKTDIVSALEHSFVETSRQEPTCEKDGYVISTCELCGEEKKDILTAKEHTFTLKIVVAPTIDQKGSAVATCSECKLVKNLILPAFTENVYGVEKYTAPDCVNDGSYVTTYSYENASIEIVFIIKALGHDYRESVIDPTCIADGYTLHQCSRCTDHYETDTVSKLGHNFVNDACTRCTLKRTATFSGRVYQADGDANLTNNPLITNATLVLFGYNDVGEYHEYNLNTDSNGVYTISNLDYGQYSLKVNKEGYVENIQSLKINMPSQQNDNLLLVNDSVAMPGSVSGLVNDAVNGRGIADITVQVRKGTSVTTGDIITSVQSNSSGNYSVTNLPIGNYTLLFVDERTVSDENYRYGEGYINIAVISGASLTNQNISVSNSAALSASSMRIVLTWGSSPSDLDSHLTISNGTHVYYGNKSGSYANLDVDDTSAYGPETITISNLQSNYTYKYYIYNYSGGSSSLMNSGATVKVFLGNSSTPYYTFNVPSGSGVYWTVFSYNPQTGFSIINRVSNGIV